MESWETRRSFPELIRADREIPLSPSELDAIFDLGHYTRFEKQVVERVLAEKERTPRPSPR